MASNAVRLPSPARAMFQGTRSMRPILKRPGALPLSSAPSASFSSLLSPSYQRALKSPAPHVRFPSSPTQLVATIHTSSLNRSNKPAPLSLESDSAGSDKLSNAFWNSVSIESAEESMVTALEYPESAVEYEEKMDIGVRSASQPSLMFAGADGVLFSPGLPNPRSKVRFARKEVTAPSPHDPFAAFPSFGAVLEKVSMNSRIQFPGPVAHKD